MKRPFALGRDRRSVSGKRVVITGASGGIGSAAMHSLREAHANVIGIDLHSTTDEVLVADVRDVDQVRAVIDTAVGRLGSIDVLVNNAGIGRAQDAGGFPGPDAKDVMDINFWGAWNVTAAAMPHLLASRGRVVNVSSGLAFVPVPFATAYTASKRALAVYSASLRAEYTGRLSVTTVYPGYIRTPIHDASTEAGVSLEGLVRPDSIESAARTIVKACATKRSTMTTSPLSAIELGAARRFPRSTRVVISRRMARWRRRHPIPSFLVHPDPYEWEVDLRAHTEPRNKTW